MKVEVERKAFLKALGVALKASPDSTSLPVLYGVKIAVARGALTPRSGLITLSCSNLEIGIEVCLPAVVEAPGLLCVHAKHLYEITSAAKGSACVLQTDGAQLRVETGESTFNLNVIPDSESFPELPVLPPDSPGFSAPQAALRKALAGGSYASGKPDDSPILGGVLLEVDFPKRDPDDLDRFPDRDSVQNWGKVEIVSTDTHRLARCSVDVPEEDFTGLSGDTLELPPALIPRSTVDILVKALDETGEEEVSVAWDDRQVSVSWGTFSLAARQIAGQYPSLQRVWERAEHWTRRLILSRADLKGALTRALVIGRHHDEVKGKVILGVRPDRLQVFAESAAVGRSQEPVEAVVIGEPCALAVQAAYLVEALDYLEGDQVYLSFQDCTAMVSLEGEGSGIALAMPMTSTGKEPEWAE